jgi:hypothetical protein
MYSYRLQINWGFKKKKKKKIVTLGKGGLGFILIYLYGNMAEAGQFERSWDFAILGRVSRNRGKAMGMEPSGGRRAVDICLMPITSKSRSTSPSAMSSAGVFMGRWVADYCLDQLFRFSVKFVVRKAFGFKERFYCLVVHCVLGDFSGPLLC